MKKSPLSTPGGSSVKHGYGWKHQNDFNGVGYAQVKVQSSYYSSKNGNQRNARDDFIPLNMNSPQNEPDRHAGDRHGPGNHRHYQNTNSWYNGSNNQYQNSGFHNSYSPYKQSMNSFRGRNKKGQKDSRRRSSISSYVNLRSFLEDPWADLVQKMGDPKQKEEVQKDEKVDFRQKFCDSSSENLDDSGLSQESRNIEESLSLSEQDLSQVSRADSSVDLKFDEMKFSQDQIADTSCNSSSHLGENEKSQNAVNTETDNDGKCK